MLSLQQDIPHPPAYFGKRSAAGNFRRMKPLVKFLILNVFSHDTKPCESEPNPNRYAH